MCSSHVKRTIAEKNIDTVFDHFKCSMLEFCQQNSESRDNSGILDFKREWNSLAQQMLKIPQKHATIKTFFLLPPLARRVNIYATIHDIKGASDTSICQRHWEKIITSEHVPWQKEGTQETQGRMEAGYYCLQWQVSSLSTCVTIWSALTQQVWGPGTGWRDSWWCGQGFPAMLILLSLLNSDRTRGNTWRCIRESVGWI